MQQLALLQMMNSTLARGVAKHISSVNDCQEWRWRSCAGRGSH
jgi:hypothetical protein